jgi:hypothetical protein
MSAQEVLMIFRKLALLSPLLAAVLGACIAEVEQPAGADDEAVRDHVEALGFARESAAIDGDVVLVDDDLVLDRRWLLEGAYEEPVRAQGGLIEKGYRYSNLISAENQGNVKLAFATGAQEPTKVLREGFIAAAKAWSSIPGSSLRVSTRNTGPAITVHMVPGGRWKAPHTPCPRVDACANPPAKGRPGLNIYIRSGSMSGDCVGWSGSNLISVTRHELGHALGFAHPKESASKHVKGTKSCPLADEDACADDLNYTTIMGPAEILLGCSVTPARLTQDDYATAKAVYPAAE